MQGEKGKKTLIRRGLVALIFLISIIVFSSSIVAAQDAKVAGIWILDAEGVVEGATEHAPCCPPEGAQPGECGTGLNGPFRMGDPDIHVQQSGNTIFASEGDVNGTPFILSGTISGNSVIFTISGNGITPCIGNAVTTYKGTIDEDVINGSFSGYGSWTYEDEEGNLITEYATWTGTFTVTVKRVLPVLLVHGYCDSEAMWGPGHWPADGPFDFKKALEDQGFLVDTLDLVRKPSCDNIWVYGLQLYDKIAEMKNTFDASQVDIVAHSMGGLVARAYALQNPLKHDVRNLIMLGTPNNGSPLLKPRYGRVLNAVLIGFGHPTCWKPRGGEAGVQMTPGSQFLRDLNSAGLQPSIENYYTIAGSKKIPISSRFLEEPNDGVVEVASVQAITGTTNSVVYVHHFEYDDDTTVFAVIVNILRGTTSGAGSSIQVQQSGAGYQESVLIEDSVGVGGENHHSVPIDSTVSEAYFILASDGGELDFTLTSPGGTFITPTVAASDPLITYTNAITTLTEYDVTSPEQGNWTAHITISGTASSEVSYAMLTLLDSELSLSIHLEENVYLINDPVSLTVQLVNASDPVTGATVTAQIEGPGGSTQALSLYDDGSHGDAQANDGIYSNVYTSTATAGAYQVTATAVGVLNDEQFLRETATTMWLEENRVYLPIIMKN